MEIEAITPEIVMNLPNLGRRDRAVLGAIVKIGCVAPEGIAAETGLDANNDVHPALTFLQSIGFIQPGLIDDLELDERAIHEFANTDKSSEQSGFYDITDLLLNRGKAIPIDLDSLPEPTAPNGLAISESVFDRTIHLFDNVKDEKHALSLGLHATIPLSRKRAPSCDDSAPTPLELKESEISNLKTWDKVYLHDGAHIFSGDLNNSVPVFSKGIRNIPFDAFKECVAYSEESDEYPLWAWSDTEYERFADICGKDNYIPKEFFIESLKTVVGAIAGHLLKLHGTDQEARFYTALISKGGIGKGTAMDWALGVFPSSLIYSGKPIWPEIGCFVGSFGSGVGLVQQFIDHPRILQHYDELSKLSDKFKIHGSGLDFLSVINTLYEKTQPPSNIIKGTRDLAKEAHNSILGATTPDVWMMTFGGTGTEGSGFFQRLNIVSTNESRTVARIMKPDLSQFSDLVNRVKDLRDTPYELHLDSKADALLTSWLRDWIGAQPDGEDVTGRLQVLAQRNAMHLGWLLNVVPGRLSSATPTEVIRRAIALSNYQLRVRRKYKPVMGDNPWAVAENLIKQYVRDQKRIARSALYKAVHAERFGIKIFKQSLESLENEGLIQIDSSQGGRKGGRRKEIIIWSGD